MIHKFISTLSDYQMIGNLLFLIWIIKRGQPHFYQFLPVPILLKIRNAGEQLDKIGKN